MQFLKFLYKNGNFFNFLKTKCDQNIHQNAPNCTVLKIFLGGACLRNPLAKRKAHDMQISKSKKKISWNPPPPPCQVLGTPLIQNNSLCR